MQEMQLEATVYAPKRIMVNVASLNWFIDQKPSQKP
jgi:hypothetical protein